MKAIALLLLFILTPAVKPQPESNTKFFSLSMSGGTCINNPVNTYFVQQSEDEIINPGLYFNFGVGYGPFNLVEITELYLSLTVGYSKVSTSEVELTRPPTNAQLIIETFPILFWVRLQTATKLSPFIELGMGASRLNYIERYSWERINSTSFNDWAFAYGFGAGLNYKLSQVVEISMAIDNIAHEKEKLEKNNSGNPAGIIIRNTLFVYYLRLNYYL